MTEGADGEDEIMRYLDGTLLPEEKTAFEERLGSDITLQEAVQLRQAAILAIGHQGLANRVRNIHLQVMSEQHKKSTFAKTVSLKQIVRYGLAAAASILLVVIGFAAYQVYQLSPSKLYDEVFVSYTMAPNRGGQQPLSPVTRLYQGNDFEGVIKQAKREKLLTGKDQLLVGIAYLQLNDPLRAITPLYAVASKYGTDQQDAQFYLALAYIKNKDYDKALPLLQQINDYPRHVYHNQISEKYIHKVEMLKWK